VVTTYTKTKVFMQLFSKRGIPIKNEASCLVVNFAQCTPNFKNRNEVILSIISKAISSFLFVCRVDDHRSTSHSMHITIFSTDVHVEYLTLSRELHLVSITFSIELVKCEIFTRLQENW
jgi:galactitol-specific phosphotransferase system IIB component